jgi:hypothetical protein
VAGASDEKLPTAIQLGRAGECPMSERGSPRKSLELTERWARRARDDHFQGLDVSLSRWDLRYNRENAA